MGGIRFWHRLSSKKYAVRIYFWITASIFIIMTVMLLILYINANNSILAAENDANKKILYQVKYNIEFLDDMVRKLCQQTYFYDDSAKYIMFNDNETLVQALMRLRKTQNLIDSSVFLDSIQLYNKRQQLFYSTNQGVYEKDDTLDQLLQKNNRIFPKLKPLPRIIGEGENKRLVFSYFIYDTMEEDGGMNDTLIFNIKSSWLFDNIQTINMVEASGNDRILILTKQGEFIEHDKVRDSEGTLQEQVRELYYDLPKQQGQGRNEDGFFTGTIDGVRYFITYVDIDRAEWVLFKVKPYEDVYIHAVQFKYSLIMVTVLSFLLVGVASVSVSRHLYKPIENLVATASNIVKNKKTNHTNDEMRFLSDVYKDFQNRLERYEEQNSRSQEIIKQHFLRKLIFQSDSITQDEYLKITEEGFLCLNLHETLALGLLQVDDSTSIFESDDSGDQALLWFTITNVFSEILSRSFKNEMINIKNDQIIILFHSRESAGETYRLFHLYCEEAQAFLRQNFKISVSAFVGKPITCWRDISASYPELLDLMGYRLLYPKGCIITPEKISDNTKNKVSVFLPSLEKDFTEAIRSGNRAKTEQCLSAMLDQIQKMNSGNILLALTQLLGTIKNTVLSMNQMRLQPVDVDFEQLSANIFKAENSEEVEKRVRQLLDEIFIKRGEKEDGKNHIVAEAVKEIINASFQESGLCLAQIAGMLKMNASHLGKIFKETTGASVHEYINDVRFENALILMENTNLSILQLIRKVGFENESYFYRLFKKKYGTTPKDYVLKKAIGTGKQQ